MTSLVLHDDDGGSSSLVVTIFDDGSITLAVQDPEVSDHLSSQISLSKVSAVRLVMALCFKKVR